MHNLKPKNQNCFKKTVYKQIKWCYNYHKLKIIPNLCRVRAKNQHGSKCSITNCKSRAVGRWCRLTVGLPHEVDTGSNPVPSIPSFLGYFYVDKLKIF